EELGGGRVPWRVTAAENQVQVTDEVVNDALNPIDGLDLGPSLSPLFHSGGDGPGQKHGDSTDHEHEDESGSDGDIDPPADSRAHRSARPPV
ncbi:MAG: hypothetical protein AABZ70_17880, partial [candidate division NC10 bacterium]